MIHPPVPPEAWAAEGERAARALDDVAAALVIGGDAEAAALVAIALAKAQRGGRRVAIGDLVDGLAALRTGFLSDDAGDHETPGLLHCFRDGRPVSDIARPFPGEERLFVLPSGGAGVRERLVMESARWPRLIAGFREVDALLLLVADAGAPGLGTLMHAVDGVVAVDLPPVLVRSWPLLATVDRPEAELPPVAPIPDRAPVSRRGRRARRVAVAAAAMASVAAGVWGWRSGAFTRLTGAKTAIAEASTVAPDPAAVPSERVPADTITLGAIVNPDDSSRAAAFAVELVAANTPAGANSGLEMRGVRLPAPTLVPVLLGADGRPWYRALAGAWRDRSEAEALLRSLRDRGLVREDVGRVLRAPYALLLAEGVPADQAPAALARWESRGIPAYALLQDDGRARVYAGAFETPSQSALVALSLRDLGAAPVLAIRTGRTF